jgi:hypothetical protein
MRAGRIAHSLAAATIAEDKREAARLLVLFTLALRVMLVSPSTASRACFRSRFRESDRDR